MKRLIVILFSISLAMPVFSQAKKSLTIDDLVTWNRITERAISDDGSYAAFVFRPWDGDPKAALYDKQAKALASFPFASDINITSDSRYMVFTINQPEDTVRVLKIKKTKKEDMPINMLGIYNISKNTTDTVYRIRSHKVPVLWAGWIAYQCEPEKKAPQKKTDDTSSRESQGNGNGKKTKAESADNGYHLLIRNLKTGFTDTVKYVTEYILAEKSPVILCSSTGEEGKKEAGVLIIDLVKDTRTYLTAGKGKYKQLSLAKQGDRAAFIMTADTKDKTGNSWSLYHWNGSGDATMIAGKGTPGLPEGWIINENARLSFGEKSNRLFFGTSPAYKIRDTTVLDEDRPNVDVWHYAEGRLHTVQVINRQRDMRRNYMAVWHDDSKKIVQLGTPDKPDIQLPDRGDAACVLATSNLPYELESMWEGGSGKTDVWLIDIYSGDAKKLKEGYRARPRFSPAGKYLYWYHSSDSSWYTYDIEAGKEYRLTTPATLPCHDELNDVPDAAGSYPAAGWLKDDEAFLISDRYDIWSLDPRTGRAPVNLTLNGRKTTVTFRLFDFDPENDYIDPSVKQYLSGFNETSRESGYYSIDLRKKAGPTLLKGGAYRLGTPVKARNESIIMYTMETFEMFPDYHISDLALKNSRRLTDANPQQKEYLWGSAEVVKWVSLDGREIEGLLYKPEGFDPARKYPMIVNFYEKSSSGLYSHHIPEPGRSTIDYHYYTGNGYLIFNPDVYYIDGYPGQSAYNCVMPGVMSLVQKGFVDDKRIGAQGHSWGGYQVAYLATRTNLFAAIESGAPVVNMYSAYGGIRWETGLNRSFQYEHQQSRIGATIWEAPYLYWENSPLFTLDKVTTPILIMANDQDGHVPWWQGIEYFIGLRRLGKPAWLLNYNGEPHWPLKHPNKVDFQKRMSQFFAHYLKGEPMPQWMKEGVPATEKNFTVGY